MPTITNEAIAFVHDITITKPAVGTIVLLSSESEFENVVTSRFIKFTHELGLLRPTSAFHTTVSV